MKVVSASIVRGTAQPGIEITFRGEESDSVEVHLKENGLVSVPDSEIYARAKQVIASITKIENKAQNTFLDGSDASGGAVAKAAEPRSAKPAPLGMIHTSDSEILDVRNGSVMEDLEGIRTQIAELRETISNLGKASFQLAETRPLATMAIISFGLWVLLDLTKHRACRGWW